MLSTIERKGRATVKADQKQAGPQFLHEREPLDSPLSAQVPSRKEQYSRGKLVQVGPCWGKSVVLEENREGGESLHPEQ